MSTGDPASEPSGLKPLAWLHGEIKTPPFSTEARVETGFLLWRLQRGETLSMPVSRPMPGIGPRCHELRVNDRNVTWRIFYRLDSDAVLVVGVEEKKTKQTPKAVLDKVRTRLRDYDRIRESARADEDKGKRS